MSDKTLLQLPLATTSQGALLYGIQNNEDKAFTPDVLMGSAASQAANFVYAGPVAPPGALPSFRRLVANDIPDLSNLYMKTTGGALVSPVITNPTITGGTISGTTIIADDDKWRLRNAIDTTKIARFDASAILPGTTRTFSFPNSSGELTVNTAPQDLTNKAIYLRASQNTGSTFRIAHGQAPASPVDGDIWTTAGGIYAQISGVTVGPLAAEQTSYVTSFNTRIGAITLLPADITAALGYTPWNTATNLTTSANLSIGGLTTQGPNILNGTSTVNGTTTINNDLYVTGAVVTGTNTSANLTIASDSSAVYVESINRATNTRKNLNLYGTEVSITAPTTKFTTGSGNYTRFTNQAGNMTLQAVNSGATAVTPLILQGSETQIWGNGAALQLKIAQGYTENQGTTISIPTSPNPGAGGTTFGFRSIGSYGGGYSMLDGSTWGGWWMSAGNQNWGISDSGMGALMTLTGSGALSSTGGWGPGSDPRLKDKKSFRRIDNALEKVYNLNVTYGKYHDWYNPDGKERVFLMADEAMKQNTPHVILSNLIERDGEKYDGWSADQMIALCIKAIQELTDEVANLKEQINEQSN